MKCKTNKLGHCTGCNNQIGERHRRRIKRVMSGSDFVAVAYRKKCGKCRLTSCVCEAPAQNIDGGKNKKL